MMAQKLGTQTRLQCCFKSFWSLGRPFLLKKSYICALSEQYIRYSRCCKNATPGLCAPFLFHFFAFLRSPGFRSITCLVTMISLRLYPFWKPSTFQVSSQSASLTSWEICSTMFLLGICLVAKSAIIEELLGFVSILGCNSLRFRRKFCRELTYIYVCNL